MLYITIISVVTIVCACIIGSLYIAFTYNPKLYAFPSAKYIKEVAKKLLDKYDDYDTADDEDKYKYAITQQEVKESLETILMYLEEDDDYNESRNN